ncbi:DUF4386 domain-containing protein [Flavobacterium sp. HNIBRBA15423]|uniref:DUF4386 domain-containing protein n=1 Tax=Flavobacterium sp. HNIBRBA15423 TaxID=3458683 RepID=UPI004043A22D
MMVLKNKIKRAGVLIIISIIAGVFSISTVIDSSHYLTEAATNSNQVLISSIFQFILFLTYLGFAILLYPIIKKFNERLALGFLSFRIVASLLLIIGTIILLSILALSQEFIKNTSESQMIFEAFGNVLKITRDYSNHVFMVLTLGIGNLMLYILFLKSRLIPKWLSVWGILGTIVSIFASVLLLFQLIEVITFQYLILNVPIAVFELILGLWLITKGFKKDNLH